MTKKLAQTEIAERWLQYFPGSDKIIASKLLDGITWISSVEFNQTLEKKIKTLADSLNGPVALLIERELRKNGHGVQLFYKQKQGPRTAYGAALQPVESLKYVEHEVGSEGVIANLATSIRRQKSDKYFIHPTIEQVKKEKIKHFVILTDTIGTGTQTSTFLDSIWKVATIKSLSSFKRLDFHVISYAATDTGLKKVSNHATRPTVSYALKCPTIDSVFEKKEREKIKAFCATYFKKAKNYGPLGYDNGGVLLVYSHGIPNNAPTILHKKSKRGILPLFPNRAFGFEKYELNVGEREVNFSSIFRKNGQLKLATSEWLKKASDEAKEFILVLSSLNKAPRSIEAVSDRTLIKKDDVNKHIELALQCEWITKKMRLTDDGLNLLKKLRRGKKKKVGLSWNIELLYYPESLRVP